MSNNKIKKIAYVSGTRADFGLMTPVLRAINQSQRLKLQVYATGMHLLPEFGNTLKQVKQEFENTLVIKATFKTDDRLSTAKFTADFLEGVIRAFRQNRPDFVLILGDRSEMLGLAVACLYLGIPTGHLHGGEKTGTVDEIARHAITKLSSMHFPATAESARRIIRLGEEKWRVKVVGAPALDFILKEGLPARAELFRQLGLDPAKKIILLTQHPVSDEWQEAAAQIRKTIKAVKTFNLDVVAIYPNADAGGRKIIDELLKEKRHPWFHVYSNLEYKQFLALEREAAVWVGNSSAGLIESSSFKTPVVNIGSRQAGRQHGANVIDVGYNEKAIAAAIQKSLNDLPYLKKIAKIKNPWGDGTAGQKVAKILAELDITPALLKKQIVY